MKVVTVRKMNNMTGCHLQHVCQSSSDPSSDLCSNLCRDGLHTREHAFLHRLRSPERSRIQPSGRSCHVR